MNLLEKKGLILTSLLHYVTVVKTATPTQDRIPDTEAFLPYFYTAQKVPADNVIIEKE